MRKKSVAVDYLMQKGSVYFLTEPAGRNFHPDFHPQLTPSLIRLGAFKGIKHSRGAANRSYSATRSSITTPDAT